MLRTIIFPSDVKNINKVHDAYWEEYNIASKATDSFLFNIYDLNSIQIPSGNYFYHGWMMPPEYYSLFYNKCHKSLINNPEQYHFCHHFNKWYPFLNELTPKSIIIDKTLDISNIVEKIQLFMIENNCGVILKDFVKSIKHKWKEACYIPKNSSAMEILKVVMNFINIKNSLKDFRGDIVVREFIDFDTIGYKDFMPMHNEIRSFIKNGEIMMASSIWSQNVSIPTSFIKEIADIIYKNSNNNFFTIDIAKSIDKWLVIEIGDGQVSSIPDSMNKFDFFKKALAI